MTKKQIIGLIACMLSGVCLLSLMVAFSPFSANIPRQSFDRNLDPGVYLGKQKELDLRVNSFYIAGATKNTIYLGNWTAPLHLAEVSLPDLDTLHRDLTLKDFKIPDDFQRFRMKVDSPSFFLSHNTLPAIFKGQISDREAKQFLPRQTPYFVDVLPIGPSRLVLKSLSSTTKSNELATLALDTPHFKFNYDILEKQVDGFFCVDGNLHFDKETGRLVYVYAYRNECIVMDSSLNVISRFHTIDTFKRADIKVADVKSKNYSTLASPPAKVNLNSSISGNLLYVQSPFLAKNESKIDFRKSSPIDVYNIEKGQYLYSFHLNVIEDRRPSSFTVTGKYLAAIYDHYLVLYILSIPEKYRDL